MTTSDQTTSTPPDDPNALTDACGPHCGTDAHGTRHCRHCHAWSLVEADGCAYGRDDHGTRWHHHAGEDHVPGSHELTDLGDQLDTAATGLTYGAPVVNR